MIYILLNVLFNAFILSLAFEFVNIFFNVNFAYLWSIAYMISGVLTLLGYTRFASMFVSFFIGGRKLINRERQIIEPILQEVIQDCNAKFNTRYSLGNFKLRVVDYKSINAFALGYNLLCFSKGSFEAFTREQLKAVVAHELGHLYYRDSVNSIALIFSSFGTKIVMFVYAIFLGMHSACLDSKDKASAILWIILFCIVVLFLPIMILNWIGTKLFYIINMAISRKAEYRADAFASVLGYKQGMIESLEVIDGFHSSGNSFVDKLASTHPVPMLRIGALEDEVLQLTRLGGLQVVTPDNLTIKVKRGGFFQLTILVIAFGALWCAFGIYYLNAEINKSHERRNRHKQVTYKSVKKLHKATPALDTPSIPKITEINQELLVKKDVQSNSVVTNNVTEVTHSIYYLSTIKPILHVSYKQVPTKQCAEVDQYVQDGKSVNKKKEYCRTVMQDKQFKEIEGYRAIFKDKTGKIVTKVTHSKSLPKKEYTLQQINRLR